MVKHVFTRRELYIAVWADAMQTVAGRLGVSDVAVAQACRRAQIPVPPRGHWAKIRNAKPSPQPKLPDAKGIPDRVVFDPPKPKPPPPPRAQAIIDDLAPKIEPNVPKTLRAPHPAVTTWLEDNNARAREAKREGWGLPVPDLTTDLERRRLRIYSALFVALERRGFNLEPGRDPESWIYARKSGQAIEFRIYRRQRQVKRPLTKDEKQWSWNAGKTEKPDLTPTEDLILKIKTYTRGAMAEDYRDQKGLLEEQLPKIVAGFEAGIAELIAWREEQEAQRRAWELERQEQQRRAALKAERQARATGLFESAAVWRKASELRAFIAAVEASPLAASAAAQFW